MITIFGNKADKVYLEDLVSFFESQDISAELSLASIFKIDFSNLEEPDILIVYLSPDVDQNAYKSLQKRRDEGKTTINLIKQNLNFSHEIKSAIGANYTVFQPLSGENTFNEIFTIFEQHVGLENLDKVSENVAQGLPNPEIGLGTYDELLPEESSNKAKIWIGIIAAAIIIGGGIWGYNAYVESSAEKERIEASNREVNAWNEYSSTDKGSVFLFMNGLLSNKTSNDVFSEIFEKYIKDKYGNEPDIEDKIQGLVTNYYMEFTTPISLLTGMSTELGQKYSEWNESGSSLEWNPVEAIENAGVFNFISTEPVDKGKLVKIHYSLDPNHTGREDGVINIKWENGGWTIDDFYKEGISFKDYLSKQINDATTPLFAEGNNLWNGELLPATGETIPVSIIIKVEDDRIVSAQFINDADGKSILLKPNRAEGYELGLENSLSAVNIKLNLTEDKALVGKFSEYGEEFVEYDIQFRKE